MSRSVREDRRRPGQSGQPVREDPPQRGLDGPRPGRRSGGLVRARPDARRQRRSSRAASGASTSMLVKPLTYMNDSGLAVRKVLAREHAPLVDLLVVADDFALPFGKLRFREGGSAGGHNGLRSIIDELGNEAFSRLRVGIGDPGTGAIDHVLSAVRAGRAAAPGRAPGRRGGCGRGLGPRGHLEGRQPVQRVPAPPGRRRAAGRPGRGRRPARAATASAGRRPAGASRGRPTPPADGGERAAAVPRQARRRAPPRRADHDRVRRAQGEGRGDRGRLRRRRGRRRGRRCAPVERPPKPPGPRPHGRDAATAARRRPRAPARRPPARPGGSRTCRSCRRCSSRAARSPRSGSESASRRRPSRRRAGTPA